MMEHPTNKVYCENCRFASEQLKRINELEYYREWWCKNPIFTTTDSPVYAPHTGKKRCLDQNRDNNCKGFMPRTKLQIYKKPAFFAAVLLLITALVTILLVIGK